MCRRALRGKHSLLIEEVIAMRLAIVFVLSLVASIAFAQGKLERVPVEADFRYVIDNATNLCNALLSPKPKPKSLSIALVGSKSGDDADNAAIASAYLGLSDQSTTPLIPSAKQYQEIKVPTRKLTDTDNSRAYQSKPLAQLINDQSLSNNATIIVRANSQIDTSLLIENARSGQMVIEQQSNAQEFHQNLTRLRQRQYSQNVRLFDFTPQSDSAISQMNVKGSSKEWQKFSEKIRNTFNRLGKENVVKRRSLEALVEQLRDPTGGVVILYAHAEEGRIWLDTDTGIQYLTVADIEEMGRAAGGKLPPIILLNCQARATLAPAFLKAGSPFVVATDKPLGLDEAAKFIDRLAKSVFSDRRDVIDAYYEAQRITKPYRLRPIAHRISSMNMFASLDAERSAR